MKKLGFITVIILPIMLLLGNSVLAQPNLEPSHNLSVYRIEWTDAYDTVHSGTGIALIENGINFIVTNRHVLLDWQKNKADSIYLYKNRITGSEEVMSGPEKCRVYLKKDSAEYCQISDETNIDLAIFVLFKNINCDCDSIFSGKTDLLLSYEQLELLVGKDSIITSVGYRGKNESVSITSPEYNWGYFISMDSNYIISDVPIVGGNSGSPLLAKVGDKYLLIGIVAHRSEKLKLMRAVPTYRIRGYFQKFFGALSELNN